MPSAHLHGGAEEALVQFCIHRATAGVTGLRVVFLENGALVDRVSRYCITEIIDAGQLRNGWRLLQTIRQVRCLLRETAPDAVLGWMTKAHIYSGLASCSIGIPAMYFQMGLPDQGWVDRFSRLIPAAGALTCSEFAAQAQRKVVRHPVRSVHLAADSERFAAFGGLSLEEAKRRCGLPQHQKVVGIVGRLQYWKGIHVFVDAVAQVLACRPTVRGIIVGGQFHLEREYEGRIKADIEARQLADRITMVGVQTNVPEWMAAMDMVVHTSDQEPFGIVVVEAMTLGKAVIATIPGGPAEIVRDQIDGQLVPFGNAKALADAIENYLDDPEFSAACGRAASERAKAFRPEVFARNLAGAIQYILGLTRESKTAE